MSRGELHFFKKNNCPAGQAVVHTHEQGGVPNEQAVSIKKRRPFEKATCDAHHPYFIDVNVSDWLFIG